MKTIRCNITGWLSPVACGLLAIILFSSSATYAADARYLWQSRDQFVALERQDNTSTGPAQPNNHPLDLTLDRLTAILESIDMRATDGDKPEPLFTRSAIENLAPYLLQGLQEATPAEDVTFAVIGLYNALYGLAKSPKVTTGRLFHKDGRLNIIVGLVQQEVKDRDDRRLVPFTPGSRLKAREGEWKLLPHSNQTGFNLIRKDWVAFSDEWRPSVAPLPVAEKNVTPVQAAPVQPGKRNNDTLKPAADRLTTLNELRDKGLISMEEYREKRMEILNGL
jgi:hypothetical protein